MTERRAVIAIVFNRAGRLLLGRKVERPGHPFSNQWHLPGGKVNPGETDEAALHREVAEETSLKVTIIDKVGECAAPDGYTWIWFICSADADIPRAGDDLAEAGFFTLRQAASLVPPHVSEHWPTDLRRAVYGLDLPETRYA